MGLSFGHGPLTPRRTSRPFKPPLPAEGTGRRDKSPRGGAAPGHPPCLYSFLSLSESEERVPRPALPRPGRAACPGMFWGVPSPPAHLSSRFSSVASGAGSGRLPLVVPSADTSSLFLSSAARSWSRISWIFSSSSRSSFSPAALSRGCGGRPFPGCPGDPSASGRALSSWKRTRRPSLRRALQGCAAAGAGLGWGSHLCGGLNWDLPALGSLCSPPELRLSAGRRRRAGQIPSPSCTSAPTSAAGSSAPPCPY